MSRYNEIKYIAFNKSKYKNGNDFWKAISLQIKLLTQNDYVTLIAYEDCGIYRIEYYHADRELGDYYPIPLLPEEEETLDDYRK